jgi:hypothetical protein
LPKNLAEIQITASKLHPRSIALITKALADAGANLERFVRTSAEPVSICVTVSGIDKKTVESALTNLTFEDATTITVKDL